ncbi:class I SAM-dependent DNA methyltransferase [Faecalibacterium sp. Marseille-Q4164]|jgi:type I restriction-modification system DNA methylase subunit|uniref:class I SAM-dependent DNA methyltransferase n=1 Tax=Faecalibacterium sp. Marseille-Q4164 TaxID=2817020 RepID=UPI001A9AD97D|nr:class I SAM-dependent DNA methyltransferase [Faecalibacterium sp. Marseille-Q4164]MBO1309469.1 class I SAM-dependent DNA methyltransferase [Faecalibacterium sp. Marseille-Q4164]
MSIDLTGITNKNEYYTNHYFSTIFEENAGEAITAWAQAAKSSEEIRTPWAQLRQNARQFYPLHDRYAGGALNLQLLAAIRTMADRYLASLGYPEAAPELVPVDASLSVPVYLEMKKSNGAPLLWVMLSASRESDAGILESNVFDGNIAEEDAFGAVHNDDLLELKNEDLATQILFGAAEPPRFLLFISLNQIALIDRNKWSEKRYLQFELEDIFSRLELTTLQAMVVLLHKDSLCPEDGSILLDELNEQSQKNAAGVSQDLKYALRECIELLGNEVLHDMRTRQKINLEEHPVDAGQLTLECLRYMYRMLFILFIEARPELGYAPIRELSYLKGYSLESLRDIADAVRDDVDEVSDGYYLHETLAKLYDLIYNGYPETEAEFQKVTGADSIHDVFLIAPLKAHIFDPEYTKLINATKLRNSCMLRIIDLMSLTRASGKRNSRRGRISYANLGINQMGAVYEALLSYRGFIAQQDLYEVKRAGVDFNELDVGYFVSESDLAQYTEEERVRYASGNKKGKLRMYAKGTFIYRLAGREREKSASYYTPEVLTKCLVKYALKELLKDKSADDILHLTICEPAMGSAAFLNEAINQLAEAYISRKEQETGEIIGYEERFNQLQKVKMFIADRNVYGVDLNPVAVELAEVSLWLNTIYPNGFVPWFGTQLVNGNSLIGARRQCYRVSSLQATSKGLRWYEKAPERVPLGTERKRGKLSTQIYHFLLGDPGMCSYTDKVIKQLEPAKIKFLNTWNKAFTAPYCDDDIETLKKLSKTIDKLWKDQISLRQQLKQQTHDSLSVFKFNDDEPDSHTSIRTKDQMLRTMYRSENAKNAGAYARLKFAMDYWCALWFWPIDKADLLPSRSEFLNDMYMILVGLYSTNSDSQQLSMLEDADEEDTDILLQVNLDELCALLPRLRLARTIAQQNHFMHWELEFADVFAERGGFDLMIGNPPWIKIEWNEQGVLADANPMFAVKKLTATQTTHERQTALENAHTHSMYFAEYEMLSGEQNFLNAVQNYPALKGQQTNLFKCFLPLSWEKTNESGIAAFVHPEGVYDDPKGGPLMVSFDTISNLYDVKSIVECYQGEASAPIPGIKDANGDWNITGHPDRIIHVTQRELEVFAKLFDGNDKWPQARLPVLHVRSLIGALSCIASQTQYISDIKTEIFGSEMWHETNAQKDGTMVRNVHFPESLTDMIISGPHIAVANPCFKTSRSICRLNSDYDNIDLTSISDSYLQRCNYQPYCAPEEYEERAPLTPWNCKNYYSYRIAMRNMFNQGGERTLMSAIIPPKVGHVHAVYELGFKNDVDTALMSGLMESIPYDFYIKATGKGSGGIGVLGGLPIIRSIYSIRIILTTLLLNSLNEYYAPLWKKCWNVVWPFTTWSKSDPRLSPARFTSLTSEWTWDTPLRTDYERRQALVEIDVLTAMALGMTLQQLKTIYRIQFPVLQSYEADTWYDANGRITFTNNRSLTGVGFTRPEWENAGAVQPIKRGDAPWDGIMKHAPAGYVFARTITDDTMPGGPVQRTIEYAAPFDRCDREQDYETAWKFFEEKYKE